MARTKLTLENYVQVGAKMRLLKMLSTEVGKSVGNLLSTSDAHRLNKALDTIESLCVPLEDAMLCNHSKFEDSSLPTYDYTTVFYGNSNNPNGTPMGKHMHKLINEEAKLLLNE